MQTFQIVVTSSGVEMVAVNDAGYWVGVGIAGTLMPYRPSVHEDAESTSGN